MFNINKETSITSYYLLTAKSTSFFRKIILTAS